MHEGVALLAKHIGQSSNTRVIIDADADGYTSAALLLNYLNRLFPYWVQNCVTYKTHEGKQHGLNDQDFSEYLEKNIRLVIIPDAASNDYIEHKWLADHNIDCLILDHHEVDNGYSNNAVVINNQLSKSYPTKSLCGGGVVYKFCCYFDKIMGTNYAIEFEDLAALAEISDMMNIRDFETHYIIKAGLQRIQNPFFV